MPGKREGRRSSAWKLPVVHVLNVQVVTKFLITSCSLPNFAADDASTFQQIRNLKTLSTFRSPNVGPLAAHLFTRSQHPTLRSPIVTFWHSAGNSCRFGKSPVPKLIVAKATLTRQPRGCMFSPLKFIKNGEVNFHLALFPVTFTKKKKERTGVKWKFGDVTSTSAAKQTHTYFIIPMWRVSAPIPIRSDVHQFPVKVSLRRL